MRQLSILITVLLSHTAMAGDFKVHPTTSDWLTVDYTGTIDFEDEGKFRKIMDENPDKKVMLFIDSGGGYAWAGVDLYWAARDYRDRLHTVAGYDFGAWSAAALFWAGGTKHIAVGGAVGFHLAYCNAWNPPGCDTRDIDAAMQLILEEEFGCTLASELRDALEWVRGMYGVSGWVVLGEEGAYILDTRTYISSPYPF